MRACDAFAFGVRDAEGGDDRQDQEDPGDLRHRHAVAALHAATACSATHASSVAASTVRTPWMRQ